MSDKLLFELLKQSTYTDAENGSWKKENFSETEDEARIVIWV